VNGIFVGAIKGDSTTFGDSLAKLVDLFEMDDSAAQTLDVEKEITEEASEETKLWVELCGSEPENGAASPLQHIEHAVTLILRKQQHALRDGLKKLAELIAFHPGCHERVKKGAAAVKKFASGTLIQQKKNIE